MASIRTQRLPRAQTREGQLLEWVLLLALTVMWGSAFLLTKVALASLPSSTVVGGRLVIASIGLIAIWLIRRRGVPAGLRVWWFFFLFAVFGNALPYSLISWGQAFIDSGLAGILMAIMPLITLVLSHFVIPGERLTRYRVFGFLAGFCGIVVLMGPDALTAAQLGDSQLVAMLAVLGGAVCYAIAAVLARLRPAGDALVSAAATTVIGAILLFPVMMQGLTSVPLAAARDIDLIAVLALGVFSTAIASIVYFRLISSAGPAFVSQLNYLIPLWAVFVGVVFLGEQPQMNQLYALLLILCGITISQLDRNRARLSRVRIEKLS